MTITWNPHVEMMAQRKRAKEARERFETLFESHNLPSPATLERRLAAMHTGESPPRAQKQPSKSKKRRKQKTNRSPAYWNALLETRGLGVIGSYRAARKTQEQRLKDRDLYRSFGCK